MQELIIAIETAPSMGAMMLAAWQLARLLTVKLVEEVLTEQAQRKTKWPRCEKCGTRLESKGFIERQLTGLIGTVRWKRRVGRCPNSCEIGQVAPLDAKLGLVPNQRSSVDLKRAACALSVFVPFEVTAVLLRLLTEVVVSPGAIWNWVQEAGQEAMTRLQNQLEALERGEVPGVEEMEAAVASLPLLMGADGVMVPFRPNDGRPNGRTIWREIKVGVLARLSCRVSRTGKPVSHLVQRRLVAVLGSVDDLEPRLWLEARRQGILSAEMVVWLCDGGRGFWRLFRNRFAGHAMGILDFYHAAQNLWKGARVWLDGRTREARQWFVTARRQLRRGEADRVMSDIAAALNLEGLPPSARKTLENLYAYLEAHRDHINYARFKELGLPIGSGMVESACKWLIQQRFKGVGMRWSEDGFKHLLHLRLAWVNNRFDTLFVLGLFPNS
ncbi:MAG: ISKra4 family transposase [Dehalococcoidia bacterium]